MKAIQHTQTCKHTHSVEQKIGDHANEGNSAYTDMQTCTHTRSVEQKIWDHANEGKQHTQTCKHTHTQRGAKDLGPCK